ncbi:MAG: YfiR family protein [Sphingopyxis sp.]
MRHLPNPVSAAFPRTSGRMRAIFARPVGAAVAALLAVAPPAAHAQASAANQLRAAIVYNIIRFVDFGAADGAAPLTLCVARGATGARELAGLHGQRAGARTIAHRAVGNGAPTTGCSIVYLGAGTPADIAQARQRGVLVIGEGTGFIGAGGIIGLVRMGNQTRFEVNMRAARQAQLSISSNLLRLAARVEQ